MEYICKDYIKLVVLKVNPFWSEIVDEKNFCPHDTYGIQQFKQKYIGRDDCVLVRIEM